MLRLINHFEQFQAHRAIGFPDIGTTRKRARQFGTNNPTDAGIAGSLADSLSLHCQA